MAATTITFVILQLLCFFVVNECKLNEFYRWKQISFEKLEPGKSLHIFHRTPLSLLLSYKNTSLHKYAQRFMFFSTYCSYA